MDADRFDLLLRSLVTPHSRRGLASLLGGLFLGGALALDQQDDSAARRRKRRRAKDRDVNAARRRRRKGKNKGGGTTPTIPTEPPPTVAPGPPPGPPPPSPPPPPGSTPEPTCPTGQLLCSGRCVDPNDDDLNCGACGQVCGTCTGCFRGECCSLLADAACTTGGVEGRCLFRTCNPKPTCKPNGDVSCQLGSTTECCGSGVCNREAFGITVCRSQGANGTLCLSHDDCTSGFCFGYRCTQGIPLSDCRGIIGDAGG